MTSPPLRVVTAVASVTFREILRDKILYNTLVISVLLFGVGVLASKLTFVEPGRVVLDFGLVGVAVSSGLLGTMVGAGMLAREFERRTILVALTRPITRLQFILGKFTGLKWVLIMNSLLLSAGYLLVLRYLGAGASGFTPTLAWALVLLALQSLVLAALAVFFSTFSTTSLSVVMTLGMYFVGINCSQIRMLALKQDSAPLRWLLDGVAAAVPNFEYFNLGLKVTYGLPVSGRFIGLGLAYGSAWILLLLVLSGLLLERRES
jgi:ABC-type transport system involved in multi-copper enzyme maturation permease subunit